MLPSTDQLLPQVHVRLGSLGWFLQSLPGINWVTDPSGVILAIGQGNWNSFAEDNHYRSLHADDLVGTSMFAGISGDAPRSFYVKLHAHLLERNNLVSAFNYRCDGPSVERRLSMRVSAIRFDNEIQGIFYQSAEMRTRTRPKIGLFERFGSEAENTICMCSICHDVTTQLAVEPLHKRWVSPVDYYREGGTDDVCVEHGICGACEEVARPRSLLELVGESQLAVTCCMCGNMGWPVGEADQVLEWIAPTEFYHRGGPENVALSYGMCEGCAKTAKAELNA